jgi:hypothetical protein
MMDNTPQSPIGEMNIMDASGHQQLKWDMGKADEIAAAQATFDRLVKQGYGGFGSKKKMEPKQGIKTFDPTMEEVVMVPRIVGG